MNTDYNLVPTLKALGMTDAFTCNFADLSGMDGDLSDLYLTGVFHKAFVKVDEKGTEAAAATGITVGGTSAPPEPIIFDADHPFIFYITYEPTGSILFLGKVEDPR
jgi:serpin B